MATRNVNKSSVNKSKGVPAQAQGTDNTRKKIAAPAPQEGTQMDTQTQSTEGKAKRTISDEARAKGSKTKHATRLINEYVKRSTRKSRDAGGDDADGGGTGETIQQRIEALQTMLDEGKRDKLCPVFDGKVRVLDENGKGKSVLKSVPLKPAERLQIKHEIKSLQAQITDGRPTAGRKAKRTIAMIAAELIPLLPDFCSVKGYVRDDLIEIGLPPDLLDQAGIGVPNESVGDSTINA